MKLVFALLGCAACAVDPATSVAPTATLADLAPELRISTFTDDRGVEMVGLDLSTTRCAGLIGGSATLAGIHGQPLPGGIETIVHEDFAHTETVCSVPRFRWARTAVPAGLVDVEVSDGETTLRMAVHLPSQPAAFALVEQPASYLPHETLTLRTSDPGELSDPAVFVSVAEAPLFSVRPDGLQVGNEIDPTTVLVVDGNELRFEVPPSVTVETAATLVTVAGLALRIDTCESPWGCASPSVRMRTETAISLSPAQLD